MTKVLFTREALQEEDDYLNFLSMGYKIEWDDDIVYFPLEVGDQSVTIENQRVSKIKYKRLSAQYRDNLLYMLEQIVGDKEYSTVKKVYKQLEKEKIMKKTILIPAGIAEKIIHFKPENRLLSAIGQFSPERRNFWHPVQSYYLTNESICEANAFFRQLRKSVLHSEPAMRRFCAANPDARQPDFWCPTYDFAHFGMVNDYRLRCMCNHGDFNYLLMVYRKSSSQLNGKAA